MANVRIVSASTVQALSNKEPTQRIDLAPCDLKLLLLDPIQKGLLFLKPKPSEDKNFSQTLVQNLKYSLSRTLDFFYPLAGRLAAVEHEDNTTSFFILCNNTGAQFVHAVADGVTIFDVLESIYVPPIVHAFFPLNGVRNYEGVSKPLLGVQVTELVDGIFIGCTMNHSVVDGTSFWNFINCWSEISRGLDKISKPPVLHRSFLDGSYPIRIPDYSSIKQTSDGFIPPQNPIQERVFHFTRKKIAELKSKANAEAGTEKISSLQSLLAHLWRSVIRCRKLDPDQDAHIYFSVGLRSRLLPPLPEQYFGNAVEIRPLILKATEVLEQGLGHAALQMNKLIASHTEDKVRESLERWIENPKLVVMGSLPSNAVLLSSSPRFNMYGNDFGWGRPVAVRSGRGNKVDGKVTLFPGVEEGSTDIEACFSSEVLQAMGNDSDFMDAVTI